MKKSLTRFLLLCLLEISSCSFSPPSIPFTMKLITGGSRPTLPKCVAFSFSSASTADQLSSSQLRGAQPSCIALSGIISPLVTSAIATSTGVQFSLPAGTYDVVPVGIETTGSCSSLPTIFSGTLPLIYRLGLKGTFNTANGQYAAVSNFGSVPASDLVPGCLPSGFGTAVVTGFYHSCVLQGGGVKCWGTNDAGQLGDNGGTGHIAVSVVGLASGVSAIAGGEQHNCALLNTGEVRCWGNGSDGRLGQGLISNAFTPGTVLGLTSGVTAITAGGSHSCAVQNGAAKCWGRNLEGQLGDNSNTSKTTPVAVFGFSSGVTAISAGNLHTCAIKDGLGYCWGQGSVGQLGTGAYGSTLAPAAVVNISSYTAISAGVDHTCGIRLGRIYCWGSNSSGQLGYGGPAQNATPAVISSGSTGAQGISAGNSTCAVIDSALQCWGENGYGQLGNNSTANTAPPVTVQGLSSGGVSISTSNYAHSCGIASGTVYCWGSNSSYQLGTGDTVGTLIPSVVPNL